MSDNINISEKKTKWFIYVISMLSAIGGFLFGYDTGVVSGAMVFIKDYFHLNDMWQELIVSATILSAWIFSMIAGYVTDSWGRKPVILTASFIFTLGAILMGIAWNKFVLLAGRFIVGAAIGFASMTVPMYIAEVAPHKIRGKLVTVNNCFITGGQFVAALIAGGFSYDPQNGWRYMLGIAAIPSIIQFFGFIFMPESPRWLIKHGKYEEAKRVLEKICDSEDIEKEFATIKDNCDVSEREQLENGGTVIWRILQDKGIRRALMVGCILQMIQQMAGINTVMYYSATIIQMSGIHNKSLAVWLASLTAAVNFVFTFVGLILVERIGRRLLTLVSLAGVAISLILLGIGFQLSQLNTPPSNWHDSTAINSTCQELDSCFDCISNSKCGFCYYDESSPISINLKVNGTCLVANPDNHLEALVPSDYICSNGTTGSTVWAYDWCPSKFSWMILTGLMLYLFFFAPGMGPMPWTINSEIYPLWSRSVCTSTTTSINWFFNLLVSFTFLSLTKAITTYGAFYLYALFSILGWIYFVLCLPETRALSLERIESLFSGNTILLGLKKNRERESNRQ